MSEASTATAPGLTASGVPEVDEVLPLGKLGVLGLQHVLVMYAGAIAVPLIVGRALGLDHHEVSMLISADLFVCGLATLIQSYGFTQWFGVKLPVIMGVTFASVSPMIAIATTTPGIDGARTLFGSIIGAGIIAIILAPIVSRMLKFFPPVVTGTIITVIGVDLMRVGVNWIFGNPVGPTAPSLVAPEHLQWLESVREAAASGAAVAPVPDKLAIVPTELNPRYAPMSSFVIGAVVLGSILAIARFFKGFFANISVLLGIIIGGIIATAVGMMTFERVGDADWFAFIIPFHFGMPIFDPVMIFTMTLIMLVVMIESTGMFLALGDLCHKEITQDDLAHGLRTDGLGTLLGGIFNTFPYSSFSQNVGLVAVTGIRSRFVTVASGIILICLGLMPKMAALVESLPTVVLGGAGLVMFGMVAATGIRILGGVDFHSNRDNMLVVAVSIGIGMIPLVAPNYIQWLPHGIHPIIKSGIVLASISAVLLNIFFNGGRSHEISSPEQTAAH